MGRVTTGVLLTIFAIGAVGCASTQHQHRVANLQLQHTIFNPEWTRISSEDVPREAWPVASGPGDSSEVIEYEETIIDRQGGSGNRPGHLSRRFRSVRRGQLNR